MEFDPEYQTVLDVKGARGIEMARWVLSNLASREVNDVHIRIEVDGAEAAGGVEVAETPTATSDGGTEAVETTDSLMTDRDYEQPDGEVKDVSAGSRPHTALALLAEYEHEHPDDPWVDTQSLYDEYPSYFRNPQDLSAAVSTLFNEKALVVRAPLEGQRGFAYRPTIEAKQQILPDYPSPLTE